jgi:hypothetical protein
MKFSVVMSVAALAVVGNAMANTATTSVATPPAKKSVTDYMIVKYYGELSGGTLSKPLSGELPSIEGGKAGTTNLFNQVSLGYKNGDYRAVVLPRFSYGISENNAAAFEWDNLRITLAKTNVAKAGIYSLRQVALVNVFGTTQGAIDRGVVYNPRIVLAHEIDMGSGSRWSLDAATQLSTTFYNTSAPKLSGTRSVMGMYASLGLGYQINPSLGAAFTFETSGSITKVPNTTEGKLDYNPASLGYNDKSATSFRIAAPIGLASGKITLSPFIQTFPLSGITANNSYLGLELAGTLY